MASQSHFDSYQNSYQGRKPGESPSVPLSVYRELAGELQAARAHANVLKGKNQQLRQYNQELRQEIDSLIAVTDRMRALAQRPEQDLGQKEVSLPLPPLAFENAHVGTPQAASSEMARETARTPERASAAKAERLEKSGWGLAGVTLAIALLFAGLGFMALRPLESLQTTPQQLRN